MPQRKRSRNLSQSCPTVHDPPQSLSHTHFAPLQLHMTDPLSPTQLRASMSSSPSHHVASNPSPSQQRVVDDEEVQQPLQNHSTPKSHWRVMVIDSNECRKMVDIKIVDVWELQNKKIVIPFDDYGVPTNDVAGIYGQILGQLASKPINLPITFTDWKNIPKAWKDEVFDKEIKSRFHFDVPDPVVRSWTIKNLGRKWRDFKGRIWHEFNNSSLTLEEIYEKVPDGVPWDQWKAFVDKNNKGKYKEMCKKNASNHQKQLVPHTTGSKSFARKRAKLAKEVDRPMGRTDLWFHIHKKPDGTYVNEAAKDKGARSQDDAIVKVFKKEHSGRVRGLGFRPSPSNVFDKASRQFSGTTFDDISSNGEMQARLQSLETELTFERERRLAMEADLTSTCERLLAMEGALTSIFQKMLGTVPEEIANLVAHHSPPSDAGSGHVVDTRPSSHDNRDI